MPITLAEVNTASSSIVADVVEALTVTGADMLTVVTSVVPVALKVIAAVLVVTLGVKVFQKITSKA